MTTYFASQSGTGNGLSLGSPFKVSDFFSVASPGDVLYLLDGLYTGSNSMLTPPSGMGGTSGNPIGVFALNDGAVLINGQNARVPCMLDNSDYWNVQGVNFGNSSASVVNVNPGSDHNIFRRCIAYNANSSANEHVWSLYQATNTLLEDCAGFGSGRKIFQVFQSDTNVLRRCFGMWHNSTSTAGPMYTFSACYDSYRTIMDNCIGTRNEQVTPDGLHGILAMDRMTGSDNEVHCAYYGSIALVLSGQANADNPNGVLFGAGNMDYLTFKDCIVYIAPGTHTGLTAINAQTYSNSGTTGAANASGGNRKLTNITTVGATPSDSIDTSSPNGWTVSNLNRAATLLAAYGSETLYVNNGSKGATIRYRYQNGSLTASELWPWPMNQRIIDAMSAAGYTPFDIDTQVQSIFGPFANVGVTYYVSKTGSDSNSGTTSADPKLTIAAGLALLSAGDRLIIGPGVYDEALRDAILGGALGAPTRIQAATPNSVTLRPTGGTDVIRFNADYITVDGIDCDAINCAGSPFNYGSGVNSVFVKNARARNGAGVLIQGNDNRWLNVLMYGNAQALKVQGDRNLIFSGDVYGNAGTYGIWIASGSANQVKNNIVYGNASDTLQDDASGTVKDHNLVGTNPQWVNPAGGDFHLSSTSPAINAGADLSAYFTTDYFGNAR